MKNILITGGSDGIGLETAKLLAQQGNRITIVARSKERLENAILQLPNSGHSFLVADLTKKEDVDALKENIEANKYDVFINNAGKGMYGRFHEMALNEQMKMMNLNTTALIALSYFYLSQAKKGDALINVSSVLGTTSFPGAAVYAGTKAFVTNFSESLWWEYKNKGIFVAGFCPGVTYTNFHEVSGGDKNDYPKSITQQPHQVAEELVNALIKRKKPKTVSGGMNRFMLTLQKMMSRKAVVNMMGKNSPIKN
jgi:short-subunit dehydrogenase